MKKRNLPKRKRQKGIVLPILLLAIVCIGGAELLACRFFAPDIYYQITDPVRQCVQSVTQSVTQSVSAFAARSAAEVSAWWADFTAPKEPEADPADLQLAGDPTVLSRQPISDPSLTELKERNGRAILTGGVVDIVYYNQGDEAWADLPYGSDDIGRYGCGPTAMAMVLSSLTEEDRDPVELSQWAVEHGYWAKGSGSYLSIVEGTAAAFGLDAAPADTLTPDAIQDALLAGDLLVALMGPGHFTNGGHFILLRGITLSGTVLVADPNSEERSLMEWDPQLIIDELSASRSNGAPLWILSRGEP